MHHTLKRILIVKIYLTGLTGHLGFNVLLQLLKNNYKVIAGVRDIDFSQELVKKYITDFKNLTLVKGDLSDIESLIEGSKGVNCIINTAAIVGLRGEKAAEQQSINIEGVRNLLDAAVHNGVKRFIQISSIQTIESGSMSKPANETDNYRESQSVDPYPSSKLKAEKIALSYLNKGLEVILINPGLICGSYDLKGSAMTNLMYITKKGAGMVYPGGGIAFTDVEAAAKSIVMAIENAESGQRYILGGSNLSYKEIFMLLHENTGSLRPVIPIPDFILRVTAAVLSFFENKFSISFRVNSHRILLIMRQEYYSSKRAEKELGYEDSEAGASIFRGYTWLKENKRI
jgi:dihydroflavonol-4-reductase